MSSDTDYAIYQGTLGDYNSHLPLSCTTGGATFFEIDAPADSTYYLVVPKNATREGSYGTDSTGALRQPSASPCLPQMVGACAAPCAHSRCEVGGPLSSSCNECVASVCAFDPSCCTIGWDSTCVDEVRTVCNSLVCPASQGACSHPVCSTGPALTAGCDNPPVSPSCAAAVCAADSFCCTSSWNVVCVAEVPFYCGVNCD